MKKTKEEIIAGTERLYGNFTVTFRYNAVLDSMEVYKNQSTAPLINALKDAIQSMRQMGMTYWDSYQTAAKALQEAEQNGK